MTAQRPDPVDEFLADLGSAPVPPDLAARIVGGIGSQRQPRRSWRWPATAGVVLTGALLIGASAFWIAGQGPSPTVTPTVTAAATPSASAPATSSPSASADVPADFGDWYLTLRNDGATDPFELVASDLSGTILDVKQAPADMRGVPGGITAIGIARGPDERTLRLSWITSPCDHRGWLDLQEDGRTFALSLAPRTACDAMAIGWSVDVVFDRPVAPGDFAGRVAGALLQASDVHPQAMAWFGPLDGFVGGRAPTDDAVVLVTDDGGVSWRVTGLGPGEVSALAVVSGTGGLAYAGRSCPEGLAGCTPGLLVYDEGAWTQVGTDWPISLSLAEDRTGAGLFKTTEAAPAELRLTEDGGDTWTTPQVACPEETPVAQSVTRPTRATIVVVCLDPSTTEDAGPSTLLRTDDGGRTWTTENGPEVGYGVALDLRVDGSGWLWSAASPDLATTDAGRIWAPLAGSDGGPWDIGASDALMPAGGFVLDWDASRNGWSLLFSADGAAWMEQFFFEQPCCGG